MTDDSIRTPSVVNQLLTAARAAFVFLLLCGVLYTGTATIVGGLLFPHQAKGSLVERNGEKVGSRLVGQRFSSPGYFYGRPSAADYDPTATAGSNLAPSNPLLVERVRHGSTGIQEREGVAAANIPVDLLAASGSGIDPHISLQAAYLQARRVAQARGIAEAQVRDLVDRVLERPQWGLLGEPRVNVLLLNLALDEQSFRDVQ